MPLVLAPSFDDHTREQIEAFIDQVRIRRIAGAIEYQQSKMHKLDSENSSLEAKLIRNWEQLGKALDRLEVDIVKVETYLGTCQMLRQEIDLVSERIELARR